MRLRYMTLPSQVIGEVVHEPFLLIFDKCAEDEDVEGFLTAADSIGAQQVLVFKGEVEIGESI